MLEKLWIVAIEALRANKVRSALTMLGIVIGVMSVVVLVSLGQASQAYITDQVQGLGSRVLVLTPGNPKAGGISNGMLTAQTLTLDDVTALENLPEVAYCTPSANSITVLKVGHEQQSQRIVGTTPTMMNVQSMAVGSGRFFTEQEARQGKRVAVLGAKLYKELFIDQRLDVTTDRLKIEGQRFRVVGILAEQGGGIGGGVDEIVIIPIVSFQQNLKAGKQVNSIMVKVTGDMSLELATDQIRELLRQRHKLRFNEDDDFKIQTQAELMATVQTITQVFTLLLAGIASISLLVGGIGIMNIMLVSVRERTREIGVRKAVGAKHRDILMQFLIESATLSVAGGTIGIVVGLAISWGLTKAAKLPTVVSPLAVIGAFAFSAAVGIFFGLYPANKAAKLDPVEALRYE